MKVAFKTLVLHFLTVAILLTVASCEWNLNKNDTETENETTTETVTTPSDTATDTSVLSEAEPTIPEQTTSAVSTSEITTPEETSSQETPPLFEITTEQITEVTTPEENIITNEDITFEEGTTPEEMTTPEVTTTPEETTTPELPHEHTLHNGRCACGFIPVVQNASSYDNDNDGNNDVFQFTPILPQRFTSADAIHFEAGEYDDGLSGRVFSAQEGGEPYYYCRKGNTSYIVYEINVEEAGIYELAIHQRMESGTEHGAKLTVNEESANEYSIQTSYQFATDEELLYVCNNQNVMLSYMLGIRLELVKGINEIKIEVASNTDEGQYFRDFYLVKTLE